MAFKVLASVLAQAWKHGQMAGGHRSGGSLSRAFVPSDMVL